MSQHYRKIESYYWIYFFPQRDRPESFPRIQSKHGRTFEPYRFSNFGRIFHSWETHGFVPALQAQYTFHILITKCSRSCEASIVRFSPSSTGNSRFPTPSPVQVRLGAAKIKNTISGVFNWRDRPESFLRLFLRRRLEKSRRQLAYFSW